MSLLLAGLLGGLGDLAGGGFLLGDGLDDADGHGLTHVTDGEATERRVLGESLHAHGLGGRHFHDGSITVLHGFGESFQLLARATIAFLQDLLELAGDVSGVAIHDRCVSVLDFSRVVEDDDLSIEVLALLGGVVLGVGGDVATTDLLDGDVLDVEANVVAGKSLGEGLVVHLHRFDLSGDVGGGETDDHARLDDTGLDTTDGHCSDTANLVDVLEWETKGLVGGALRRDDGVQGVDEGHTGGDGSLDVLGPTLFLLAIAVSSGPPGHLLGFLQHVVSVPSGNGAEDDFLGIVSDLLNVTLDFLTDFQETGLAVRSRGGGVHLVDSDDELLDSESVGEESVLAGLSILGDTGFELTSTGGDDEHTAIGLGSASDHVLDEIPVAWGIDDGDVVVLGLELPQGNIDGDTTLTLGLELVQHPGVFEGALAHLLGFLLELLDDTLVDATAFVDEMAGGGRLARVDVADDDDVDVQLFFTHFFFGFKSFYKKKRSKLL